MHPKQLVPKTKPPAFIHFSETLPFAGDSNVAVKGNYIPFSMTTYRLTDLRLSSSLFLPTPQLTLFHLLSSHG
ncbi:hypothetical protein E2C01_064940 [Portunus trituberculatus]|uniref:Uncharacterized protein n=1 Tax=Portunus trituberculatus TaxID=210409 RepID=A0A5B7HM65_PORTR|nr:hypothetical protein [Portunus trituberculatus]